MAVDFQISEFNLIEKMLQQRLRLIFLKLKKNVYLFNSRPNQPATSSSWGCNHITHDNIVCIDIKDTDRI